jgi:hypothetical protein
MFAILAALLGAVATAAVTHVLAVQREKERIKEDRRLASERERRERQRGADRERKELLGLLKLVHVEVVNNLELLKGMGSHPGTYMRGTEKLKRGPDSLEAPKLSSDAWDQARPRIATLIEDEEHLEHLVSGYAALKVFRERLLNPETDKLNDSEYQDAVKKVRNHQWLAFNACQEETGLFRWWGKGMLVSKPAEELEEARAELP